MEPNAGTIRGLPILPSSASRRALNNENASRMQIQQYLNSVSGHVKPKTIIDTEHDYSRAWNVHPDPQLRVHGAKYLFMKHFPHHMPKEDENNNNDIINVHEFIDEAKKIPFLAPKPPTVSLTVDIDFPEISETITESWSCEKNKLWTRANKILHNDRIARLSFEGHCNEILLKRNLLEQTANKFRELLGSTFWEPSLVGWLHETLLEYLDPNYKTVYLDSLQVLRVKIPELIETIYPVDTKGVGVPFPGTLTPSTLLANRPHLSDPLVNTLNHYKPRKLSRKPVILMVPYAPNFNTNNCPRMKYWANLFTSMGKLITLPCVSKSNDLVSDILNEIRFTICEKIRTCRSAYAGRPLILVGFNVGSLIAVHCALQFPRALCAIVCLGFPLYGINGSRGELGDPFLELSVPVQFVIGENSLMCSLDDLEDLRERMVSAETSLIVVGGADDRLVVSNEKKRLECLTQSLVDRCVAEEIWEFLESVLHFYRDEMHDSRHVSQLQQQQSLGQNVNDEQTPNSSRRKGNSRKRQLVIVPSVDGETPTPRPEKPKRKRIYKPKNPKPAMLPNGTSVTIGTEALTTIPTDSAASITTSTSGVGGNLLVSSTTPTNRSMPNLQAYPDLATILTNQSMKKMTTTSPSSGGSAGMTIDINKPTLGSMKVEKSKVVTSDGVITFSTSGTPTTASGMKKKRTLGGNSINFRLTGAAATLPSITEENSPIKPGLIQLTDEAIKVISPSSTLNITPTSINSNTTNNSNATSEAKANTTVNSSSASTTAVTHTTPTVHHQSSKDSYTIEEVPVIPVSASRTGRPIKPPKSLNI